jgi:predicted nucleic-acid-binding protein
MKPPGKVHLIDTNVILRYLLDDHARFSPKAKKIMKDISEAVIQAEIRDVVIVECIYVLEKYYQVPKKEVADKLSGILNFKGIANSDKPQILKAMISYKETGVDIVDCLLAAHSSPERLVVSFDNDFKKLKAFQSPDP